MITKVSQIDTPEQWVELKKEYDLNQAVPVELKTSRQQSASTFTDQLTHREPKPFPVSQPTTNKIRKSCK